LAEAQRGAGNAIRFFFSSSFARRRQVGVPHHPATSIRQRRIEPTLRRPVIGRPSIAIICMNGFRCETTDTTATAGFNSSGRKLCRLICMQARLKCCATQNGQTIQMKCEYLPVAQSPSEILKNEKYRTDWSDVKFK
jgi:hypothetical protein